MSSDQFISVFTDVVVNVALLPLEYSKVQAQVRYMNHKTETPRPLVFAREAISANGVNGVYVGAGAMVARSALYNVIRGGIYASLLTDSNARDKYRTTSTIDRTWFSGLAAGLAAFIVTPFDLVLLRQQTDNQLATSRGYSGLIDGLTKASSNNAKHLFTGASLNSLKFGVYAATMMSVYDLASEFWPRIQGEFVFNKVLSITSATLFATFLSMPFDNIKTKLQHQDTRYYRNAADCFNKTLAREGFFGLYVGYWHYFARTTAACISINFLIQQFRSLAYD